MVKRKLGNYQKVVLRGILREGKQPTTIKNGYRNQVKSLLRRKLIKTKGNYFYLTSSGRKRIQ